MSSTYTIGNTYRDAPNTSGFYAERTSGTVSIFPNNAATPFFGAPYNGNSPSQTGLLFLYTNGKTGQESGLVFVTP